MTYSATPTCSPEDASWLLMRAFAVMYEECLMGPDVAAEPGCGPLDRDGDGDVDLADYAAGLSPFVIEP